MVSCLIKIDHTLLFLTLNLSAPTSLSSSSGSLSSALSSDSCEKKKGNIRMCDMSQKFHDMLQSLFEFSLAYLDVFCQTPDRQGGHKSPAPTWIVCGLCLSLSQPDSRVFSLYTALQG